MSEKIKVVLDKDIEELIPHFLESRSKDIASLTSSIDELNFKAIEMVAHKLAGNAGSYGFTALGEVGKTMEKAAKNENIEIIKAEFEKMKNYLDNIEISYEE